MVAHSRPAMARQFRRCSFDVYYQHLDGQLYPRGWGGFEVVMRDINAAPGVQAWWRSHSHWFTEEFAKFINQQQQPATRHDD
jgi:hypothetical protein